MDSNIINKKITNNNKITSISINTSTSKKYIYKESYSSIIYLLIKKGFTYFGEIKRTFNLTTNIYLPNLERAGILFSRVPSIEEKEFIKSLNVNIGNKYLEKPIIYEFTPEGLAYFTQPKIYDMLKVFIKPGIDEYVILQREKYNKLKIEKQLKEEHEKRLERIEMEKYGFFVGDKFIEYDMNLI